MGFVVPLRLSKGKEAFQGTNKAIGGSHGKQDR